MFSNSHIITQYLTVKKHQSSLWDITKATQNYTGLQAHAEAVDRKFTTLLQGFTKCHNGYNSALYMDDGKIKELGTCNNHI